MIRVNLLPKEERESEPRSLPSLPRRDVWLPIVLGVAFLLPLAGVTVMQQAKVAALRGDIARAEEESRRLAPQIERIRRLMQERAGIDDRLRSLQGIARDRYLPVEMLDDMAERTPEGMWFTKLDSSDPSRISLEGMTFSNLLVADLMTRLEESDIFDDVQLSLTQRGRVGAERVVRFQITSKVLP